MISYRELVNAFREIGLNPNQPVIVHASLSSLGEVRGGAETMLGALLTLTKGVMAPTFTYKTMVTPEVGPQDNAIEYGTGKDQNRMADFFLPDMPADPLMGVLPEMLRKHPSASRSMHPILSFAAINLNDAISAQTLEEPLAPIRSLTEQNGMVVLIGVDHSVNSSIHYAERMAGRKQFVRWALTPQGVRECPGFPGCSDGFEQATPYLAEITKSTRLGEASLRAVQMIPMMRAMTSLIKEQPRALLCHKNDARCEAVRRSLEAPREMQLQ